MSDEARTIEVPAVRQAMPSLAPQNFHDALTFSKMLAHSSFVPKEFRGKPDEILAAIQYGFELGVGPMQALQNIAVINGKPSVYGDLALALVQASGKLEYIKETDDGKKATCIVKRVGMPNEHVVTFSDDDAKAAGLLGKTGPWTQYRPRMRQFRARGFALRDVFADVLKGLITREEAEDYPVGASYDSKRSAGDSAPTAIAPEVSPDALATAEQKRALTDAVLAFYEGDEAQAKAWMNATLKGLHTRFISMTCGQLKQALDEILTLHTERQAPAPEADAELATFKTQDEQAAEQQDADIPF